MSKSGERIFGDGIKEGAKLESDTFKTIYNFYKFLTSEITEQDRLAQFGDWQGLDGRTVEKYVKKTEEGTEIELKSRLKKFDNIKYLKDSTDFSDPEHLRKCLAEMCKTCEWREVEKCRGKAPANGCPYYCKSCKHRDSCKSADTKIPKDCKILKYEFMRVDNAVALPYLYAPLKYILPLRNSKVMKDNEVLETLNGFIESLKRFLGNNFDLNYISCIIRYAYLYNLIDHLPPEQECTKPTENPITWLFAYSRRSLSISRIYNERALEDTLKQIVTDSIDDERVELWKQCSNFEKDLLKSQEAPKLGSVDSLLEYAQKDTSMADIVIFLNHFADINFLKLRPIDIKILQKCLCWKDYSFKEFLKKLPQLPEHLEEWFSKK